MRSALWLAIALIGCADREYATATVTLHTYQRIDHQRAMPANALWVGAENAHEGFTAREGNAGVYTLEVDNGGGRFGFAVACTGGGVKLIHSTIFDGTDLHIVCEQTTGEPVFLLVETLGCATAMIGAGEQPTNLPFALICGQLQLQVLPGPHDVLGASIVNGRHDRLVLVRDVSSGTASLDFDGPASAPAERHAINGPGFVPIEVVYSTPSTRFSYAAQAGDSYGAFPVKLRGPDDIHTVCGMACKWFKAGISVDTQPLDNVFNTGQIFRSELSWDNGAPARGGVVLELGPWQLAVSARWLAGVHDYLYPPLCTIEGFPAPCLASISSNMTGILTEYVPHDAWTFGDIISAHEHTPVAKDGLEYSKSVNQSIVSRTVSSRSAR